MTYSSFPRRLIFNRHNVPIKDSTTSSVYVTTELHEKRVRAYLGNCACVLAGHKQREFLCE